MFKQKGVVIASLMVLVSVAVFAQSAPAPQQTQGSRWIRFNCGREWRTWTDAMRQVYVNGFMSGQADTYNAVSNNLSSDQRESLYKATFLFYGPDAIADVMTDLYKDPANTFIRHGAMVYIARDKLSGRDVEPMLRHSREDDGELFVAK
jgi:hypothetical protein